MHDCVSAGACPVTPKSRADGLTPRTVGDGSGVFVALYAVWQEMHSARYWAGVGL